MTWSREKTAGFALAALLSGDRDLSRSEVGLCEGARREVRARLAQIPRANGAEKTESVRALAALVKPPLRGTFELPERARALLARVVPRELGKSWLERAPLVRSDYQVEPGLVRALERVARWVERRDT